MADDVERLVQRIRSGDGRPGMTTKVVAIDGLGGSGKSTLAARLATSLEHAAGCAYRRFCVVGHTPNWWPRLRSEVLEPLRANARHAINDTTGRHGDSRTGLRFRLNHTSLWKGFRRRDKRSDHSLRTAFGWRRLVKND